jgi:drug/metabolite transporter (DMT)-like permease
VNFYDWMLALHILSAFAIAAALVLFSVQVVAGRRMTTLEQTRLLFRLGPFGTPLITGGTVLVLILGVILAIDSDDYQLWDAWVIIAIVLWALVGVVGQRTGAYYTEVQNLAGRGGPETESEVFARLRAPTGVRLHAATVLLFLLLLLDMFFKPFA